MTADPVPEVQLRRYQLAPGTVDDFVGAWRRLVAVREQYGFRVEFAVVDRDAEQFVWAVSHVDGFAAAEEAYYASPERAALPVDPAVYIVDKYITMVQPEQLR